MLATIENSLEGELKLNEELTQKIEHLTPLAESVTRLTDQLDEYRQVALKARKDEAVMEKYKKRLESMAELHQSIKGLEESNSELIEKNLALTDSLSQSSSLQRLVDTYRSQITTLESKSNTIELLNEKLQLDLNKTKDRLKHEVEESSRKDELLREREDTRQIAEETSVHSGDDFAPSSSVTALKLKIRQLERSSTAIDNSNKNTVDRMVMEQLIEDERKSKERYEMEFLAARRDVLRLESIFEDVLSGQSKLGDEWVFRFSRGRRRDGNN